MRIGGIAFTFALLYDSQMRLYYVVLYAHILSVVIAIILFLHVMFSCKACYFFLYF